MQAPVGPAAPLTMDELRARIRVAGLQVAEARLEMVRRLVGDALAPIRAMAAETQQGPEPAVRFDAAQPEGGPDAAR